MSKRLDRRECAETLSMVLDYIDESVRNPRPSVSGGAKQLYELYISCIEKVLELVVDSSYPLLVGWSGSLESTAMASTVLYNGIVLQDQWSYYALLSLLRGKKEALLVNPWYRPYFRDIVSSEILRGLMHEGALYIIPHRRVLRTLSRDRLLGRRADALIQDVENKYETLLGPLLGVAPRYVVGGVAYASSLNLDIVSDDEDVIYVVEQGFKLLQRKVVIETELIDLAKELKENLKVGSVEVKRAYSEEAYKVLQMIALEASHRRRLSLRILSLLLGRSRAVHPRQLAKTAIAVSKDARLRERFYKALRVKRGHMLAREILVLLLKLVETGYDFLTLPIFSLLLTSSASLGAGVILLPQILLSGAIAADDALDLLQTLITSKLVSLLRPGINAYITEFVYKR